MKMGKIYITILNQIIVGLLMIMFMTWENYHLHDGYVILSTQALALAPVLLAENVLQLIYKERVQSFQFSAIWITISFLYMYLHPLWIFYFSFFFFLHCKIIYHYCLKKKL